MSASEKGAVGGLSNWPLDRLLALVGRLVGTAQQRLLAPLHLTPTGHTVLTLVARQPMSFREIAGGAMVRPATVTAIIDALEDEGYVERQPDRADRRVIRVAITALGVQRLQAADDALGAANEELFGALGPQAADRLRKALVEVARQARDAA
jgi:DNA-binding MarR family transcriptional regulator